jgi:hypothetical protein
MKDQETVQKFIELRAQGSGFVRIAAELGVAKSTLTEWSPSSCLSPSKTGRAGLYLDPLDRSFRSQTGTAPTLPQMVP